MGYSFFYTASSYSPFFSCFITKILYCCVSVCVVRTYGCLFGINTSIELLIKFNYTHNNGKFMRFLLAPFTLNSNNNSNGKKNPNELWHFSVELYSLEDIYRGCYINKEGGCFDGKINVHG